MLPILPSPRHAAVSNLRPRMRPPWIRLLLSSSVSMSLSMSMSMSVSVPTAPSVPAPPPLPLRSPSVARWEARPLATVPSGGVAFATTRGTRRKQLRLFSASTPASGKDPNGTEPGSTKSYSLEGVGTTGTSVRVSTNGHGTEGHQITTDVPKSMGGQNLGPQPVELLLASWMGCTQATASFVGRQLLAEKPRDRTPREDPTAGTGEPEPRNQTAQTPKRRRRKRRSTVELLLAFEGIRAFRDERGALELPIVRTPETPSRLQRITGRILVAAHRVDHHTTPARRDKDSDHEQDHGRGAPNTTTRTELRLDPDELSILKEQTEARCPIANMILASGCEIDVEWVLRTDTDGPSTTEGSTDPSSPA